MNSPFYKNPRHVSSTYEQFIRHDVFNTKNLYETEIEEILQKKLSYVYRNSTIDGFEVTSDGILVTFTISHE